MNRLTIGELMIAKPVTIAHNETIGRALEVMTRYDIRRLPVLKAGKLTGIISDRDIRQLAGRPSLKLPSTGQEDAYLQLPVGEAMTPSVITVRENQTVQEAIAVILKNKISGVPVVNRNGELTGMLSYLDVLKYCHELLDREADKS